MSNEYIESRMPKGSFAWMIQQRPKPLGDRPIKAGDNQRLVYTGQIPYWMPVWMTDNQYCWPDVVLEHPMYDQDGFDWFGVEWVNVEGAGGQMVKPGTRVVTDFTKWREQLSFPDLDKVDFEGDAKLQISRYDPTRFHSFNTTEGLFERLHEVMPFDEALLQFYEEPELVQEYFSAVCDYKIKLLDNVIKYYDPVDYIIYGDDWGTQRAGFFSNKMFRDAIMPQTKRLWDFIHSKGKFIELHSCGLTQQYIEEIIEMGCDAWTPQNINDFDMLTEKYGNKITLTIPVDGISQAKTEEEARALVRSFVDKYAPRGRIIAGTLANNDAKIIEAASDELYKYSSSFYAAKRAKEGK